MHCRVSTFQGSPERLDDVLLYIKDQIVPEITTQSGFKGIATQVNRSNGKSMTTTFWETAQDMEKSRPTADDLRSSAADALGLTLLSVEEYEIGQRLDAAGKETLHLSQ